jgi:hypothetical protein
MKAVWRLIFVFELFQNPIASTVKLILTSL